MNLFMLSNDKNSDDEQLFEFALTPLLNRLKTQKVKKVLVIPYAVIRFSYDECVEAIKEGLSSLTLDVTGIHEHEDPVQAVLAADAIFVSGGNTWAMNKALHDNGLVAPIRKKVLTENTMYVGWSAGSVVCAPNMCTTNDMCIVDAAITSSLNLVPFHINPHYIDTVIANHMGETRDERIEEFMINNPYRKVLAIPEGSWLQLDNDGLQYCAPHNKPCYLFTGKKKKTAYHQGDDLSFLL